MLVDVHAHVYPPNFPDSSLPALLATARDRGVVAIVNVPESLRDCETVFALSHRFPMLRPAAGLHPVQGGRSVVKEEVGPVLEFVRQHVDEIVAVGECGLDYSPHVFRATPEVSEADQREEQLAVFRAQLSLAAELNLPVNVHSRSAGHHAITEILSYPNLPAVLHAFDGRAAHAVRAAQSGLHLSVPSSIVRDPTIRKWVAAVPLDSLLLETDSPALPAERGGASQPADVDIAAREIAAIKGVGFDIVAAITGENARKLFPGIDRVGG
ncbi:hypothetical protein BDK51DRAFT_44254 [Blyttiomyces helicus]|uniref:Uncharacterized protein n=1 Tax=Blyttiomyces helicus TaxID=388810 RepID=A0A4P9W3M4_9FUNG|nr:hypothetical protein BDK51DRAFT_44254 [Blyttiomyces helicus]|eukprot:RKO86432.1 hypothetical protein BDK51DRAFT_44254 [Blyttiomyces helicus]